MPPLLFSGSAAKYVRDRIPRGRISYYSVRDCHSVGPYKQSGRVENMISECRFIAGKLFALLAVLILVPAQAAQAACDDGPVVLQVLGSGGPFGAGRASAGYLIWIDGVARIMVDAGGGTFARFHEAGANVEDLELLALSHYHPDHSSEVPALLWVQPTDMLVSGPTGNDGYPSADEYVNGLFGPEGVFRAVTDGKGLKTVTVDVTRSKPTEVFANESVRVRGLGVPHGIVPAIGYRIDIGDVSIAFSSDQNGSDAAFAKFASGVDVLVVHVAVPESAKGFGADLHARPSVWGQMATDADVGTLVLSHLSSIAPRKADGDLEGFDEKLTHLRSRYEGPLVIAEDLMCVPITSK
jgi:ribonuclease BN (tRNA processing enzyme)